MSKKQRAVKDRRVISTYARNQLDAELRSTDKGSVTMRKMMRLFLIGMLCGVMVAAAFTYVFAIPANNYHWQSEIWERGGAAWIFDMKTGHMGWKWMVEPKAAMPRQKRVTAPSSPIDMPTECL